MKRLLSAVIATLVLMNCTVFAHAEENPIEDTPQKTAATVTSFNELQTAIAEANDGDTIVIENTIFIESDCSIGNTEKRITLICADGLMGNMIKISNGNVGLVNLIIDGSNNNCPIQVIFCNNARLNFNDCAFYKNEMLIVNTDYGTDVSFTSCEFRGNRSIVNMNNLYQSSGKFSMRNCTVAENTANTACFSINGAATIKNRVNSLS